MATVLELQRAGFSDEEIANWVNEQRIDLTNAGYNEVEQSNHFGIPFKSKTRTLHKSPLGNPSKCKSVKQHMIHSINLGNADNHLRQKHSKDVSKDFGSGTNRLDRYRIPEDLIFSLFLD